MTREGEKRLLTEIEKQYKWLMTKSPTIYMIDIAFDAIRKAVRDEAEQEPDLDKIRAEIAEYGSIMVTYAITNDTKTDKGIEKLVSDVLQQAKEEVLQIIDKHKAESEEK